MQKFTIREKVMRIERDRDKVVVFMTTFNVLVLFYYFEAFNQMQSGASCCRNFILFYKIFVFVVVHSFQNK